MDYEDIKKLMDDMGESKLDSLEIEFPEGIKISMTKNTKKEVVVTTPNQVNKIEETNPITVSETQENLEKESAKEIEVEDLKIVKSPMVGTFYESSSPEAEAFVKVGDKVKKGQVLCIIEAMKLMNEIESEFEGEIIEICAKNEEMVEYGMPLFKIK